MGRVFLRQTGDPSDVIGVSDEQPVEDVLDVAREDALVSHMEKCGKEKRSDNPSDDWISQVCEQCHKLFYVSRKESNHDPVCPYCWYSAVHEEEEEAGFVPSECEEQTLSNLEVKAAQSSTRMRVRMERSGKWENTAKEQISLEPGSEEYREYLDDLEAQDPLQPDDPFHQTLEERNENLVTKLYEKPKDNPEAEEDEHGLLKKQPILNEAMKRAIHADAVRTAIAEAAKTQTMTDDQLARAITTDNPVLYDPSVKVDEYDDVLADYVLESAK